LSPSWNVGAINAVGAIQSPPWTNASTNRLYFFPLDEVREGIAITRKDGTVQYVNPAFENIMGFDRHEIIHQNPCMIRNGEHDLMLFTAI
jgi:PAS domain-containing protein